jgi:enamine deaminase RidA (YjgF/YER057c/UK114 family)
MSTQSTTRTVAGEIDGPEHYGSTVAAAGGFAFIAATAMDATGALATDAAPPEPYTTSPAAQAQAQTEHIFSALEGSLAEVGTSVGDILQVEQYVERKVHADPYFKIATSKKYLGAAVPVAATAQVGEYHPKGAVVSVTGLAIVADEGSGFVKSSPDEVGPSTANRKFSEIVVAGPYAFTTLFPSDRKSGLPEAARTPEWIWSGSEIGAEAKWGLAELENRLKTVGASFADVVDYTIFLTDPADLFEWDQALKAAVGDAAPSRTVIPSRGYALPRREGAFGHADGAPRMEVQLRIRRPEAGEQKLVVSGPGDGAGYQSAGVRLGSLLWLSSQHADPALRTGDIRAEIDSILDRLAEVSTNGGTSLDQALRIRAQFRRAEDVPALADALRARFPSAPPVVSVLVVPCDFPVPTARVAIDAVVAHGA